MDKNTTQEAFRLGVETAEYSLKVRVKDLTKRVDELEDTIQNMEYYLRHFTEYDSGV